MLFCNVTNKILKRTEYRCSILPGSIPGCHLYFRRKAMSERIYRSVGELYLDWIFSCINKGKIITW